MIVTRKKDRLYYLDRDAAQLYVDFLQTQIHHIKTKRFGGQLLKLEPWQKSFVWDVFGTKRREDDLRRFRTAFLGVPRKNGKSTLSAGLALGMLFIDREPGAEIYSAARNRKQARIVFDVAKAMVRRSAAMSQRCEILRDAIYVKKTDSVYRVLSSDALGAHGENPHGIIFDELHTQPNRELWDALQSGRGARDQPLTIAITTAGHDTQSICYEVWKHAEAVASGEKNDPDFYSRIYAAPPDADWQSPKTWKLANPCYGVSLRPDFIKSEARKALQMPRFENVFRRLYLNQWTSEGDRAIPKEVWDPCAKPIDPETLRGRRCWAGVDLASVKDLASVVLIFKNDEPTPWRYFALPFFWAPAGTADMREAQEGTPYLTWGRQGLLNLSPGKTINHGSIVQKLIELQTKFQIEKVGIDPWNAHATAQDLLDEGFDVEYVRQGYKTLNAPSKELEAALLARTFAHPAHAVLDWNSGNLSWDTDPADNIKPSKKKSKDKIDGITATIIGLALAMQGDAATSVYERRGLFTTRDPTR